MIIYYNFQKYILRKQDDSSVRSIINRIFDQFCNSFSIKIFIHEFNSFILIGLGI